jgi:hypothetical protein
MIPVDSSNVGKIGHDPDSQDLYVEFLNGSVYRYSGVDHQTFEELRYAPSVGSFLNRIIKPNFPYSRL